MREGAFLQAVINLLSFIWVLIVPAGSFAQSRSEGDYLFRSHRFSSAVPLLLTELKNSPGNARVCYELGVSYLNSRSQKELALLYLEKAVKLNPNPVHLETEGGNDLPVDVYNKLGMAYELSRQYDKAAKSYEKHLSMLNTHNVAPALKMQTEMRLGACRLADEIDKRYTTHLPAAMLAALRQVNPATCGYSVVLGPDKKMFVHSFKTPVKVSEETSPFFEPLNILKDSISKTSVIQQKKQMKALRPDTIVNVTTIGTSTDGQILLTYKNDTGEGNLYFSKVRSNKWTQPEKIIKPENPSEWETAETVSPDGKVMYFVSIRPDGYGGKDIYRCTMNTDGKWGRAINLGPEINSTYDDEAPVLHPDGKTLYFSSNRMKPEIAFDHFMSVLSGQGAWGAPVMVGYPVDRSKEEVFYQVSSDKKKIFKPAPALSKRELKKIIQDSVKTAQSEEANILLSFANEGKSAFVVYTGVIKLTDKKTQPNGRKIDIIVRNNKNGEIVSKYHADEKGKFSFAVPPGENLSATFESDSLLNYSVNLQVNSKNTYYQKEECVILPEIKKGSAWKLNNVFFDTLSSHIRNESSTELNAVTALLKKYGNLRVEIANTIFNADKLQGAKRLSKERAQAVKEFLIAKGIDKKRISTRSATKKGKDHNYNSSILTIEKIEKT
jgi:outer membrane protein OmpA-like peptidoglycan-associated protein